MAASSPGPGAYNPVPVVRKELSRRPASAMELRHGLHDLHGMQDVARPSSSGRPVCSNSCSSIIWSRKHTPPSIPRPLEAYGYEEDENGNLMLQAPEPEPQHPLFKVPYARVGPGRYSPKSALTLRSSASISFPKARELPGNPWRCGTPTPTAPGEHLGMSCNPVPHSTMPSPAFMKPVQKQTASEKHGKRYWRAACAAQGPLRDMQRRPGESGTTGWGERRPIVEPPGPGDHRTPAGVGSVLPVPRFPRQRRALCSWISSQGESASHELHDREERVETQDSCASDASDTKVSGVLSKQVERAHLALAARCFNPSACHSRVSHRAKLETNTASVASDGAASCVSSSSQIHSKKVGCGLQ